MNLSSPKPRRQNRQAVKAPDEQSIKESHHLPPISPLEHQALSAARAAAKGKYCEIERLDIGGTRFVFEGRYKTPNGGRRVFKINKMPDTPTGERHVRQGYTSEHEAKVLNDLEGTAGDNPYAPKAVDELDLTPFGYPGTCIVETKIEGESLEKRLKRNNYHPLPEAELRRFVPQFAEAVAFNIRNNILHRDNKKSNVIIGKDKVSLIDYANGAKIGTSVPKALPSAGGHLVMDPLLLGVFTGNERCYDQNSERFQFGTTVLDACRGTNIIEYDPINKIAIRTDKTGPDASLLTDGKLDNAKHDAAIRDAVEKLPAYAKRYGRIIQRCMTLNEADSNAEIRRYGSLDEMTADVREASKPTLVERTRQNWKRATITAAAALALFTGLGLHEYNSRTAAQAREAEAARTIIYPTWDGEHMEVTNQFVELKLDIAGLEQLPSYPYTKFIYRKQGEKGLEIFVSPKAHSRPRRSFESPIYPGRMYIEGTEGYRFEAMELPRDDSGGYEADPRTSTRIDLSQLRTGTYVLAVELYPPSMDVSSSGNNENVQKHIKYVPGQVISRQRIPLIIGDKDHAVDVRKMSLDMWTSFPSTDITNPADWNNERWCDARETYWEVTVPELGFHERVDAVHHQFQSHSSCNHFQPPIPALDKMLKHLKLDGTRHQTHTLTLALKRDSQTAYFTGLPLAIVNPYQEIDACWDRPQTLLQRLRLEAPRNHCTEHYTWVLGIPNSETYKKLIKYAPADWPKSGSLPWGLY